MKTITDEFCEAFPPDATCTGPMCRLIGEGILPFGVAAFDSRVTEIVRRCREANKPVVSPRGDVSLTGPPRRE